MKFINQLQGQAVKFVTENASGILTGAGVVGVVGSNVLTARSTFKAAEILEGYELERLPNHEKGETEIVEVEPSRRQKIQKVWFLYLPPVLVGGATIASIVMANQMSAKRAAALAAAYGISEQRLTEYKGKVLEKFGHTDEQKVRDEIAQDRVTQNPPRDKEVLILADGDVLCHDLLTGRYFRSTMEKIRKAENKLNQELMVHDSASLSKFFDDIGLEPTSYTDEVGWNLATDGVIEVKFSSVTSKDGQPAIAIDFNIAPHPSYYHQY